MRGRAGARARTGQTGRTKMYTDIYGGWAPYNFIAHLQPQLDIIMSGQSMRAPFKTKKELVMWIKDNQPYYKREIPEVNDYFVNRYGLK